MFGHTGFDWEYKKKTYQKETIAYFRKIPENRSSYQRVLKFNCINLKHKIVYNFFESLS